MTNDKTMIEAGTMAPANDRDNDAMVRKIMDMVRTVKNEIRRKKKKAPGSRFRFVMKYRTMLKTIALRTL
jgi:hypothetical protein